MGVQNVLAATLVEPGHYELREYPLPEPQPGCVLVKMELSGICGTDKHTFQGYTTQYGGRSLEFPIIQGHENVGTIAAIGGEGHYIDFEGIPLQVGDRVVVGANVCCGQCYYCRHDFPYYCCEKTTDYGNNLSAKHPPHLFGGWSQYMYIVPGSFLVKVPDDLPSEVAVLAEIFAVSVGLDRAKQMSAFPNESFRFDDAVVVLGVGPLGMCFLMKARMLGAGKIIAIDLSQYRLDFAQRLGADYAIHAAQHSQAERLQIVKDLTNGRGADMVIECAGVPAAIPEALEMLRIGGL
ncbi:MAG: alcohol dehydrogenase catalytic domain-containing protein, partial [Candidatus Sulfotelmatobacter sp.]